MSIFVSPLLKSIFAFDWLKIQKPKDLTTTTKLTIYKMQKGFLWIENALLLHSGSLISSSPINPFSAHTPHFFDNFQHSITLDVAHGKPLK